MLFIEAPKVELGKSCVEPAFRRYRLYLSSHRLQQADGYQVSLHEILEVGQVPSNLGTNIPHFNWFPPKGKAHPFWAGF